jgi:hypothetical protein
LLDPSECTHRLLEAAARRGLPKARRQQRAQLVNVPLQLRR